MGWWTELWGAPNPVFSGKLGGVPNYGGPLTPYFLDITL